MDRGYVQLYTGDGKGKTTAALGLALRAVCSGKMAYIGQFLKGQAVSELQADRLIENLKIEQYGSAHFVIGKPDEEDVATAKRGWKRLVEAVFDGGFDLVVIDEITHAINIGLIAEEAVLELIENKPEHVELVLTGRDASERLRQAADLVTEMRAEKHYYDQGVIARKGIEY